jgi:hypothetical protein
MDKHNYINNIYKVSKYLQKYVNNNDDFYLQKINNYIEKTYANQHGGLLVWDEVQLLADELIKTVQLVINLNIALKQKLTDLQLPKLNLLGASEYQIAYEIVDKNPELGINVEDLAKMGLTGTILIEESPSDVDEFFDDINIKGYDSEKRNKVLDAYTNLKKRHLPTAPHLPPYTEPLPKARSLLLSPSPSLSQPAPSLPSAPPQEQLPIHKSLKDMTSVDVAAVIATVEGCQQYEADWAVSDIDGPNVIGCNEEELNEYIIDIPGVAQNLDHRKRILTRLMELKKQQQAQAQAQAPNFGTTLLVQAILIDSTTQKRPKNDNQLLPIEYLRHPLIKSYEKIITDKIYNLVRDEKIKKIESVVVQHNRTVAKGGTPRVNIFVNFIQGVDMQTILETFNKDIDAVITLSTGMYRLFALYKTQDERTLQNTTDKDNETKKRIVNTGAKETFIASITPD